ncbi:nuclear transport factor 2 family protein [Kribbella sp. NBC_00889]|uniref:nuclear transport factor 2 family protein n=1 Tax=Kribbella sp. NBC_00889 TaxID=2975974 RepID=UPI00386FD258|nr:nuclear transport factor 2 family protein [Kribbella sp. NBC_00889]
MTQNGNSTHSVQRYVEFWNAASPDEQRKLAAATFAGQIAYHAPVGILHGTDELIGFRNQFAEHSPGYVFRLRSEPETHHDRARVRWELMVGDTSFATGTDVLEFDHDGRIVTVTGFLDRAPEGFAHADH